MLISQIFQGLGVFLVSFGVWFYLFLRRKYRYWKDLGVPCAEPVLFFGNMKEFYSMRSTEPEVIDDVYKSERNSRYVGMYHLWKPSLLLRDPSLIKSVFVSDFDCFQNHPILCSDRSSDRIIMSLFTMRNGLWRERRSVLSALFTPKRLKAFYSGVEAQSQKLLTLVEASASLGQDLELESIVQRYAIDVITSTLLGLESDALSNTNSVFIECGKLLGNPSLWTVAKSILFGLVPEFCNRLRLRALDPKIWGFFHGFVKEVVAAREASGQPTRDDFIGTIMRLKNNPPEGLKYQMTIEEITGHVYVFFDAGYDTTALITSYCLYELSENHNIQEKLRNEIDGVINSNDGTLSYEAIQSMTYMDQVVNETLRKYPPVGVLKRECNRDYKLADSHITVPKGMNVLIPVWSIHHDPAFYPDPERFNPDRFEAGRPPQPFFPFGKGPRICIGMKLAEMEIKIAVSMILRKYVVEPSQKMIAPIKYDPKAIFITIRPEHGLWVKFKPRSDVI